jgi:ferredoxin
VNASLFLRTTGLAELVAELRSAGTTVIAPTRSGDRAVEYAEIESVDEAVLGESLPRSSLKRFFLPVTEPLFGWSRNGAAVALREAPVEAGPRVVIGAPPCDAAALPIVDRVMRWDFIDEPWFARREATTVVTLECSAADTSCFCTAVGLAPNATRGADLMLRATEGGFVVRIVSDAGERLVDEHRRLFETPSPDVRTDPAEPAPDAVRAEALAPLRDWLDGNFEHDIWQELALRCHGCGVCAALCPTCHCFDIVDEPEGVASGTRRRNWDTCQSGRFTVHASGHNPRADQSARLRQRLMHKFSVYPRRFGEILCTGCGRCARACPGGVDLPEILNLLARQAAVGSEEAS